MAASRRWPPWSTPWRRFPPRVLHVRRQPGGQISYPQYEHLCIELGLADTIVPARTIARSLADLDLPNGTRVIYCYRDDKFTLPDLDDRLKAGDELVVITHSSKLPELDKRWGASAHRDNGKD